MPDVFRSCVMPKGDDGIPRPTSFDSVCCPRAVISCHVRLYVPTKGGDSLPRLTLPTLCVVQVR